MEGWIKMDIPTYSGRGPKVPSIVKNIIGEIYVKDRQQTAKEIMAEVHKWLKEHGGPQRPGWPGLSYIQKVLTKFRDPKSKLSPDPEDRPWSRISLAQYPIPPAALPVVLQVWAHSLRKDKPLTIRQALWVARLNCIFKDNIDMLWVASVTSSYHEKVLNLNAYPDTKEAISWHWVEDAYLYGQIADANIATDITNMIQDELEKQFQAGETRKEAQNER
ncbi:MAG: hypothetical protein CL873_01110 [Dehalococcoidales bacterium]|jgi:hypothetical protein|nr:hypothetical protein [Dehalococcoidales bacterium]|tara:strand:- start:33 stop:689 length:657 start_codon:yes stop_codon:yes gene_type:complete